MNNIQSYITKSDDFKSIVNGLNEGLKEQLLAGLSGSARSLFTAALSKEIKRPLFLITHNLYQAQKITDDLTGLINDQPVLLYPVNELISSEIAVASPELRSQRLDVLNRLSSGEAPIVVAPAAAVRRMLPPAEVWKESQIQIETGREIDPEKLIQTLVQIGYERTDMVAAPGEFSIRGGIIDVYSLTEDNPIRIELFDTEIDSIRIFNTDDQRSLETRDTVEIGPAKELIVREEDRQRALEQMEKGLASSLKKLKLDKQKEILHQNIAEDKERLTEGNIGQEMVKYISYFYENPASLLDYFPKNTLLILDEISRVHEMEDQLQKEEAEWITSLLEEGKILHDMSMSFPFHNLISTQSRPILYYSLFLRHVQHTSPQNIVNVSSKQMQSFHGQMNVLKNEIERFKKSKYTTVFLGDSRERVEKLASVLSDYDIEAAQADQDAALAQGQIYIMEGGLQSGFELPLMKLAVITEEELFKKRVKKQARKQKLTNAERIKSYSELQVGDYVVHVNHGIGKYLGIETLEINGIHKDYLNIHYQGSDKLYVPVDQIDQVQKYVGSEGKEPKLYKLGGSEWKRVKKKVETSVQDIADDLIKLYAEREASKGYAFSPDHEMQREFEAAFPYQETEDQLRSIHEIKKDMEKERPMDRLLCGDVGYGKTEVAIRGAFKAIADGKQVAILVPTTILAQQHYETILERFQDYPVNIGLLSRFRTRKEATETIKGLKNGTIDIVIGTHRLLSKDVVYKDLGLLIIDEEQRFGVTHKEKIKRIKANVDVLTLTATPIPRTLHMSMLGVRDLSVIETPPENRFPVQTYVVEYNGALVREAIERELARGGQVYFLYNRVEDIERKAEEISMLVPDAKVAYAHGKMTENELESVMLNFLEGESDVLVSTTIIETGVDIPNVNTLIVYDADKMGLSQLYQLRGRVGRSNRVAYAYFTYRKDKVLTEVAEKRLQAIKEFTELGSGFKIAMRDLTIRGAGNLLGAQQHGFIDSVGFDLYSQMLKEAIEARKGDVPQAEKFEPEIDLELDAYIPQTYVTDGKQKIDMYKRFRSVATAEEKSELQDEMIDRFGEYPKEVEYLFAIAEMKVYAIRERVELIKQEKEAVRLTIDEKASSEIDGQKLFELGSKYGRQIGLGMEGKKLKISIQVKNRKPEEWLETLLEILKGLQDVKKQTIASS
ncbi:transcription-repair coupling factor [Bacillus swezeyi]|uniref:Transcription-repair-coupling factor n=1 Tax=Bacillus swezeyi TaxID=1925020 RepID=A0A1R1RYL3_9BACI|nr:transcription-repair coupling factor [Bacillus swezeyi]MEC1262038.1 transcription-repair coupling factor [Bacillus swezeyi]MED2930474.1 transcription-repair coupling factor [Bacillus swezeyi]MED2945008.1 transcription-repair coupling factor [Bacillus swezeyi]MED2966558.1 transcription-repair coupling factor [Bacillus swezeyi]MED2978028.1 transcription-repair coupling factor [Bacillus swezeyi]